MPEFNALNELLKKQYEEMLLHGSYRDKQSARSAWRAINLFEKSTGKKDFTTFTKEQAICFKKALETWLNHSGMPYSLSSMRSILRHVREFINWLGMHPKYAKKFNRQAIGYLHLSENQQRASCASREQNAPTIQEIHSVLLNIPDNTDIDKRNRAIIAFLALTGVRDSALIRLKMKDIDLRQGTVWQNPNHVKTKFGKGIETAFMRFDPLWEEVVLHWLTHAQERLGFKLEDPLFPKSLIRSNPQNLSFENFGLSREHWANTAPVRGILRDAFESAGLPYFNPHSFRKMLVRYAMENCCQKEAKAISQNLGHEHMMTTYNAYGKLSFHEQKRAIEEIHAKCEL